MNRKAHLIISFIFTIPFTVKALLLWDWLSVPKYILMWFLFTLGPDYDLTFKLPHRYYFFHSLIIPAVFTLCFWSIKCTSFSIFIFGIHLLCDLYQKPGKKAVGTFCIHLWNGKPLTGKQTKLWLFINAILGCIIGTLLDIMPWIVEMI